MAEEKFSFQAEVGKLLDIVAHSLYSHKEIFLRELISNASDACDRLRYASLTQPKLMDGGGDFQITLGIDKKAKTISVSDNGIGMNRDDLLETLGTIAKSGTQAFLDQLGSDENKDMSLIGQFGVGFYSSFMVAKKVDVLTRKAGEDQAWAWSSDGKGEFTISGGTRDGRGTTVTLHLAKGQDEFLEAARIRTIVTAHSDHIGIPIALEAAQEGQQPETLNTASALWTRPRKDITEDQYKEFYHHVGHTFDDPWLTLHNQVEGVLSYTNLLFIPSTPPFNLFTPERKHQVKLYVNRVFITDDCEGLIPPWLRFLRGIVDSEDLPLNISREMFQHDPRLAKISKGLVKRVLGELKKKAEKKPDEYAAFWSNFGAVLKEGIYEDFEYRDQILGLSRFHGTAGDDLVSLDDYVGRMKPGQDAIYYITGESLDKIRLSPQLEGFKAKGVEVLLLSDPIDDFWIPAVGPYQEKSFKSATQGGADLDKVEAGTEDRKDKDTAKAAAGIEPLVAAFRVALGEAVKDVRASERLTDSAVCLVAADGDMDIHLERVLKAQPQMKGAPQTPRVLELNPSHGLIRRLADVAKGGDGSKDLLDDAAHLLFDQARIIEGEPVADAREFSRRLAAMMEKGLTA